MTDLILLTVALSLAGLLGSYRAHLAGYKAGCDYAVGQAKIQLRDCAREAFDVGYKRGHEDGWMDGVRVFGRKVDGDGILGQVARELDA